MDSLLKKINTVSSMRKSDENKVDDNFTSPFTRDVGISMSDIQKFNNNRKNKNRTKELDEEINDILDSFQSDDGIDIIDDFLSEFMELNEDTKISNDLISGGRRFARDHAASELSDIAKKFAPQENMIKKIITSIDKDTIDIQSDIENLRMSRTRNSKVLSELIGTKNALYKTKMDGINAISRINKDVIELGHKMKEKNSETDIAQTTASHALQSIIGSNIDFGSDRSSTLQDDIQSENIEDDIITASDAVSAIESAVMENVLDDYDIDTDEESEGDMYIKYENMGVELYLQYSSESDDKYVIARDRDGNYIPEYPVPQNLNDLIFKIQEDIGQATDHLHRTYKLEKI